MLHGHPFVIVGVMPRAFNGTSVDTAPDVRVPINTIQALGRSQRHSTSNRPNSISEVVSNRAARARKRRVRRSPSGKR